MKSTNTNKTPSLTLIFFLSFSLISTTYASNTSVLSDYKSFLESSEYDIIMELEKNTLDHFKNIVSAEGITLTTPIENFNYSNISKVYVDTGIEKIKTDDKKPFLG